MDEEISNLSDFLMPLRSYFYWEPNYFDILICWAFLSTWDLMDNVDKLAENIKNAVSSLEAVDKLLPQMVSQLNLMADDPIGLRALIVNTYGPTNIQADNTD